MSKIQSTRDYKYLSELWIYLDKLIKKRFIEQRWIKAQIDGEPDVKSGRNIQYLSLIEQNPLKPNYPYTFRGWMYNDSYQKIKSKIESLGYTFNDGLELIFKCKVSFHEKYGLGLQIFDVKDELTEIELLKEKSKQRLIAEQIFDSNKKLLPPYLIKRIALITSKGSNGYYDFTTQLEEVRNFILIEEFDVFVQGAYAERDILNRLKQIKNRNNDFDLIVVVRGGGQNQDLSIFNEYSICKEFCNLNIPLLTGIAHAKNISLLDEIACLHKDTPSSAINYVKDHYRNKVREFDETVKVLIAKPNVILLNSFRDLRELTNDYKSVSIAQVNSLKKLINESLLSFLNVKFKISQFKVQLQHQTNGLINKAKNIIAISQNYNNRIFRKSLLLNKLRIDRMKSQIDNYQNVIKLLDPINTLKRGYTITYQNKSIIKNLKDLKTNQPLNIKYYNGEVETVIHNIKENNNE